MESNLFTTTILPLSMAIIMLGMGLSLVVNDFKRIAKQPRAILIGIFGQIIVLPLTGFAVATVFQLEPVHAVGVMILVACAGGATSNLIVYLARGDVALSVSLTAVSSCITVITIPFIVNFGLMHFMQASEQASLPVGTTNLKLFLITLLPVLIGMFLKVKFAVQAPRWENRISRFATVFFIALVGYLVVGNIDMITTTIHSVAPAALLLNIITMAIGYFMAAANGLSVKQRVAISIEVGVQNAATGIFIAATLLNQSEMAIFPAIYGLLMYVNVGLLLTLIKRTRQTTT
jgi:BASS family bile acid:Na+ symporter